MTMTVRPLFGSAAFAFPLERRYSRTTIAPSPERL
jgi:hypothetical protein